MKKCRPMRRLAGGPAVVDDIGQVETMDQPASEQRWTKE
jgi:hypothetical protein